MFNDAEAIEDHFLQSALFDMKVNVDGFLQLIEPADARHASSADEQESGDAEESSAPMAEADTQLAEEVDTQLAEVDTQLQTKPWCWWQIKLKQSSLRKA
ncbi:hypothetical protein ABG768_018924, partial [Culter alburnus]